ncbi:uncharacterized protein LOC143587195 [Bidens hawaiensis]|uniref:uncharacterized protein LOC143587195 n=1 Tax=Bidens hawaiensis TaxID=980011 RepID=UPI00404A2901
MADKSAFDVEKPNHEDDSTINNTITTAFELLDTSIQHGSNNMKAMDSSLNLVLSLMEEVRLKEKSVEEAKEEAAVSGLDILAKAEALKQEQQRVKETNNMVHAREVYAQKASLAKDLKELQLRLSGVLREGDGYLGDFDEMCKVLKMRLAKAVNAKELADKEKQEKEALALEAFAFEESQMLKLVEESERLNMKNCKIALKNENLPLTSYNISSLRESIDQPVLQICEFKSFSQTPSCFTSSSSCLTGLLKPFHELQFKRVESVVTPQETTDENAKIVPPQNEQLVKTPVR